MYINISKTARIRLPYEVDNSFLVPLNVNLFNNFRKQTTQSIDYCCRESRNTKAFFEKIKFEVQLDGSGVIQIRLDYFSMNSFVWNHETVKYEENSIEIDFFQRKSSLEYSTFWSYDSFYNSFCQISQDKAVRLIKNNYYHGFEITNN